MAVTRPLTSSTVSPLARSATANPAICASVAAPARISPIAQADDAVLSDFPASSEPSRLRQVSSPDAGVVMSEVARSGAADVGGSGLVTREPGAKQCHAGLGEL